MSNEQKHTPEPWPERGEAINNPLSGTKERRRFFDDGTDCEMVMMTEYDYVRASACVNACAGMDDPAAEIKRIQDQDMRFSRREPAALRSQLDALRASHARLSNALADASGILNAHNLRDHGARFLAIAEAEAIK